MRESTIPPNRRLSRINEDGRLSVDISTDWMQQTFDYENVGSIEYCQRLKDRDQAAEPGKDEQGLFCKRCDSEVGAEENFCWYCGQRLKDGGEDGENRK